MNPTIYTQLAPLGFAEWLAKLTGDEPSDNKFDELDSEPIDSWARTSVNALAFRWLREDKDIDITIKAVYPFDYDGGYPKKVYVAFFIRETGDVYIDVRNELAINHFPTHPLAEHEALNKALEILSKGGSNE